jgi:hypothetical protein
VGVPESITVVHPEATTFPPLPLGVTTVRPGEPGGALIVVSPEEVGPPVSVAGGGADDAGACANAPCATADKARKPSAPTKRADNIETSSQATTDPTRPVALTKQVPRHRPNPMFCRAQCDSAVATAGRTCHSGTLVTSSSRQFTRRGCRTRTSRHPRLDPLPPSGAQPHHAAARRSRSPGVHLLHSP